MTDPHRVARLLVLTASNRLIHGADGPDGWRNTGQGGTTFGGEEFATPLEDVARNLESVARRRTPRGTGTNRSRVIRIHNAEV